MKVNLDDKTGVFPFSWIKKTLGEGMLGKYCEVIKHQQ